jgi:hypothetical protein
MHLSSSNSWLHCSYRKAVFFIPFLKPSKICLPKLFRLISVCKKKLLVGIRVSLELCNKLTNLQEIQWEGHSNEHHHLKYFHSSRKWCNTACTENENLYDESMKPKRMSQISSWVWRWLEATCSREIWGSHGGEDVDVGLLCSNAVLTCRWSLALKMNTYIPPKHDRNLLQTWHTWPRIK